MGETSQLILHKHKLVNEMATLLNRRRKLYPVSCLVGIVTMMMHVPVAIASADRSTSADRSVSIPRTFATIDEPATDSIAATNTGDDCIAQCQGQRTRRLLESNATISSVEAASVNARATADRTSSYTKYDVKFFTDTTPGYGGSSPPYIGSEANCPGASGVFYDYTSVDSIIRITLEFQSEKVPSTFFIKICPKINPVSDDVYNPIEPMIRNGQRPYCKLDFDGNNEVTKCMDTGSSFNGFTYIGSYPDKCWFGSSAGGEFENVGGQFGFHSSGLKTKLDLTNVKNFGFVGTNKAGAYATLFANDITVYVGCYLNPAHCGPNYELCI